MRKSYKILSLLLAIALVIGMTPTTVFANEEYCLHTNAYYTEPEGGEPTCFEPAMGGYWFCEDCWNYLDEEKTNVYWDENEVRNAVKKPATGHYSNTDTGVCDECGMPNPVYTKVTSLDDINEEDMYIIVAEVEGEESTMYFVLGGLDERHPDEQGNVWCPTGVNNAIRVTANTDGSISLVDQEVLEDGSPSEFMLDVNPEQFGDLSELGLTTLMLKLPNQCVYPFQSYSYEDNGYMGVSRYATEYGMWDSSEWVIDFYTTEVTDDTYRYEDEFGSKTHAEQVADGNIGDNIAEGDLLLYKASFYSVGGAMFTLRLREYNGQYYFICGEDWALEGSDGWDYVTDTTPTNDVQYAVSLYRYDVPTVNTHTCEFTNWTYNNDNTHTGTCECGETKTESHGWNSGEETEAPKCTEEGVKTYTCTKCSATKEEPIDALQHDWSTWTDDGENAATDTHTHTCQREDCSESAQLTHEWSAWQSDGEASHTKTCSVCSGTRTDMHNWNDGEITDNPSHTTEGTKTFTCIDCGATMTEPVDKTPEHEFGDWSIDETTENSHYRECACGEIETAACKYSEGKVVEGPSDFGEGDVIIYYCNDCMRQMIVEHESTDKVENTEEKVSITVPEGSTAIIDTTTELVVEKTEEAITEVAQENIAQEFDENAKAIATYDISMLLNGAEIQPGGDVEVNLPLPENINTDDYTDITVVYIDDEGNVTPCETEVNEDGTVTFVTNHFSYYSIIAVPKATQQPPVQPENTTNTNTNTNTDTEKKTETQSPQTGDNGLFGLVALMFISASCTFAISRKRFCKK